MGSIGLGILITVYGILAYNNPVRWGYSFPPWIGLLIAACGVYYTVNAVLLEKKKRLINQAKGDEPLICPKCEETFPMTNSVGEQMELCPNCEFALEPFEGFYVRHADAGK